MSDTRREIIRAFIPNSPLVGHLGIELVELEPDVAGRAPVPLTSDYRRYIVTYRR